MSRLDASTYHVPVMLRECLDGLRISSGGTYIDATLGGGGHTQAILDALGDSGTLFSFDADDVAVERCRERFASSIATGRLHIVHANFDTMAAAVASAPPINGVLFDLGVSSYQFDHHPRGFSFRQQAPLDMRFGQEGNTAAHLLNTLDERAIADIFFRYGDEPHGRKLARAAVQRRILAPFTTTGDVRDVVIQNTPPHHQAKTMARVFQALRIAVNDELGRLERTLQSVIPLLAPQGRIVVMSYHSLEDRIVKDTFRSSPDLSTITRKPVQATVAELESNPRARSARLRIAEHR
jgi:16S rRNA (cytosine1402-N4)-methyltransferase